MQGWREFLHFLLTSHFAPILCGYPQFLWCCDIASAQTDHPALLWFRNRCELWPCVGVKELSEMHLWREVLGKLSVLAFFLYRWLVCLSIMYPRKISKIDIISPHFNFSQVMLGWGCLDDPRNPFHPKSLTPIFQCSFCHGMWCAPKF